ncbi:MAG: sensor phosphodiesterase [Xanthomonadaceae bacterium]|nr:sensor phosphodiesterase [Xanthomonadaceae bacterium]
MNDVQITQAPRSRAARLRRHTIALARAAQDVLRSDGGLEAAFAILGPIAIDTMGLDRLALWQLQDGNLTCVQVIGNERLPARPGMQRVASQASKVRAGGVRGAKGRILRVNDVGAMANAPARDALQHAGVGAHIDAPLRVDETIWGELRLECVAPRRWHADEAALAGYFADVLSVAIGDDRRHSAEARLQYLELYDSVSGVANRAMFHACVGQLLVRMQRRPRLAAMLFLNVDRFFNVNASIGEAGGDTALALLAERINAATPDDAVIARVESDCFAVLLPRVAGEWEALAQAQQLLDAIAQPLSPTLEVSASIGIAFAGPVAETGAASAEAWLRNADLASKEAKAGGRNRVEVFDPECHVSLVERLRMERALRHALREDRIEVAYQAEYNLVTGEVVGAEALARWRHEDGRLLAAGEFIDVAEASGLIEPIGYRVLAVACVEACRWPPLADGTPRVLRANISARQFAEPRLLDTVTEVLAASGLPPERLCLEITETTLMQTAGASVPTLDALRALGIRLAIDDFGTGYSSLAYLRRFPVDTLKLDKAMIDDLTTDHNARAIVTAVRDLANALSLEVVVEGIELAEQDIVLRELGFTHVQGFFYARPEPADAFAARLRAGSAAVGSPLAAETA